MRFRKWISVVAIILFAFGLFVLYHETGTYPTHWAALSLFGVIPLVCGPRLFRFLGVATIATALVFTYKARQTQIEISKRWKPLIDPPRKIDRDPDRIQPGLTN